MINRLNNCNMNSENNTTTTYPMIGGNEFTEKRFFDMVVELNKEFGIDFTVTGSAVFALNGFINFTEVKDLDLMVDVNQLRSTSRDEFFRLEKFCPPTIPNKYTNVNKDTYRFTYKGFEVNIFIMYTNFKYLVHPESGIRVSTISHIIREKKKMGRVKDLKQLQNYAKNFL